MEEMEVLKIARLLVKEFGQYAEYEVNHRAELAVLRGDMEDFALWGQVVVFVSDINSRSP